MEREEANSEDNHMEAERRRTVLLIEDDPEIVNFLDQLLSDKYDLAVIRDGTSAIEKTSHPGNGIDLVLLDYRLPGISGLEVLLHLKKTRPAVPVIFLTAYGDEEVAIKAFRYGAKDYIKKPFTYREILNRIKFCLSLSDLNCSVHPRRFLASDTEDCIYSGTANRSIPHYKLQKALLFMHNNYMNKLTLDKVAERACISKYHFSRQFKKATGCTYQEYLNKLRMEKARNLLKETDRSITEAAFAVGYTDLTSFERVFKKIVGCTPRQYQYRHDREDRPQSDEAMKAG